VIAWLRRDLGPVAFLLAVIVGVYYPLAIQGRVLASLDAEAYFYPNAAFLAAGLRAGRIPLWNPYLFAGVPFLANSQVGALYPPNYLYVVGPVSVVASYLIVGHIVLFGVGMYGLARVSLGLRQFGATVAAAVAAGGGLIGGMVGHINQVEAIAWAPLTILLVERAVSRSSPLLATLSSVPLALAVLAGHTQVVYITAILAFAAGSPRLLQRIVEKWDYIGKPGVRAEILRAALILLGGPLLAVLLAAAQLVPTFELTRVSIRSTGLSFADAAAGSLPPPYFATALLPTIGQAPSSTEWLAYVPVGAAILALIGVWRRPRAEVWWLLGIAVIGLVLAFGQYTPVYRLAFAIVPGFRLFRVPARWLAVWSIGLSLLAGWGADAVTDGSPLDGAPFATGRWKRPAWLVSRESRVSRGLTWVAAATFAAVILLLLYRYRHVIIRPSAVTAGFWVATAALTLLTLRLTKRASAIRRGSLLAVLILELGVGSFTLPSYEAVWPAAVDSTRDTVSFFLSARATDRVFAIGDNTFDPGDLAAIRASLGDSLPPAARSDYVTAVKHIEGLTPNIPMRFGLRTIDGYDGGILPLARYHDLKQLFQMEGTDVADGRLRIQLRSAPPASLLAWLNVRWLVIDRLRDHWDEGKYYDLSVSEPFREDVATRLPTWQTIRANRFGIVLRGYGERPPTGTLTLGFAQRSVTLNTAANAASGFQTDPAIDERGVWLWTVDFPDNDGGDSVTVSWHGDAGTVLRALTAIDDTSGRSEPIVVSPELRLAAIGDMKIYEDVATLPRAFLVNSLTIVPTTDDAIRRLRQADWNPHDEAVAIATDVPRDWAFQANTAVDRSSIQIDDPEHLVVQAVASDRRVLVLTDSFYPGWQATVDGSPEPIIPVNLLFRGVVLQPGRHVVEFSYRPSSWAVGVVASLVGLVTLVALLAIFSRRASEVDAG
jgi:hypothetical protein